MTFSTLPGFETTRRNKTFEVADAITLDEVKRWLKIDHTDDDQLLNVLIESATEVGESYVHFDFRVKQYQHNLDDWPVEGTIFLEKRLVGTVDLVVEQYFAGSFSVTVPSTVYGFSGGSLHSMLFLMSGQEWPDHSTLATDIIRGRVRVTFQTQLGSGIELDPLLLGLRQHIAWLYENRGDCAVDRNSIMASGANSFYDPYRFPNF